MTRPEMLQIPNAPPKKETLNFAGLLKSGIEMAQQLSGQNWTDYNEHDPGVTILENLCFALTDLAYRTNHPISDILASSMETTGVTLEQQPLFTGDKVLTSAALTEADYRKLIYDAVPDVRNVWLRRVVDEPLTVSGLYDVYVQLFSRNAPDAIIGDPADVSAAESLQQVRELLMKHRNLGEGFRDVVILPSKEFVIDAVVELGADIDVDATFAQILFDVEQNLNPTPELQDIGGLLERETPPDQIFTGPKLDHGRISDSSLKPLRSDIPEELVLNVINSVAGVKNVTSLEIKLKNSEQAYLTYVAPRLSRDAIDFKKIQIVRDGIGVDVTPSQVFLHLTHLEERRRWQATYAMQRTKDIAYAKVETGQGTRQLARYRSLQHFFPATYGIGAFGTKGDNTALTENNGTEDQAEGRVARARQLKGYLLFFEQLLADYLAQLEHIAPLYSFASQDQTYFTQPLAHPDEINPDDAPDISPVLGEGTTFDSRGCPDDWFKNYQDGLNALAQSQDRVLERQNRALDHFLARYNERFETDILRRIYESEFDNPEAFWCWMIERKRKFLSDFVGLSAERGRGVNLMRSKKSKLEQRIALKSGLSGRAYVVEHVLLRDFQSDIGIGKMEIEKDFYIQEEMPTRAMCITAPGISLNLVLEWDCDPDEIDQTRTRVCQLASNPVNFRADTSESYQVSLRLFDEAGGVAEVLENFTSLDEAQFAIQCISQHCQAIVDDTESREQSIRAVSLPVDFFDMRTSVFLCDPKRAAESQSGREKKIFVEKVISENLPAHVRHFCFWLTRNEHRDLGVCWQEWLDAEEALNLTPDPSSAGLARGAFWARKLQEWISKCYCREILRTRDARRNFHANGQGT